MVHILKRASKLKQLLWIRCGPGALILPKEVSKITLEFNTGLSGPYRGARKFWHDMLPRIKYRNPSIPIQISRHKEIEGPSLLHIYTHTKTQPTTSTTASPIAQQPAESTPSATPNARNTQVPDTSEPTHTINMWDQLPEDILEAFVAKTGATALEPTEREKEEMREMKEQRERSEKDRVQVREILMKQRREEELLKMARGEIPASG